jgi:Cu/Ag efflux protein CusF
MNTNRSMTAANSSTVWWPLALLLVLGGCQTAPTPTEETVVETKDGAVVVDTYRATATVTAVDRASRKVTLMTPDGKKTTFKAGPEVRNFDQLQVGDKVEAELVEELAVFLSKDGAPPSATETAAVAVAPKGSKPGVFMADTVRVSARIKAVDTGKRKVTLQLPDGTTKTVQAGKSVDLSKVRAGDDIVIQYTEAVAIVVEKP